LFTVNINPVQYSGQYNTTELLLYVYGQQAVEEALTCIKGNDTRTWNGAAELLAAVPDPRVPIALIAAMQQRKAARTAPDVPRPSHYSTSASGALLKWIARFGLTEEVKRAAEALAPKLQQGDHETILLFCALHDPRAVTPALILLAKPGNTDRKPLIDALDAGGMDLEGRVSAALLALTKDSDLRVCSSAALALAKLKHPQAADILVKLLQGNEKPEILAALLALGDYRGLESLLSSVYIPSSMPHDLGDAASDLLKGLAEITDPRLNEQLLEYLWHEDDTIRKGAVIVLGARHELRAVPVLLEMLDEETAKPDSRIVDEILWTLGRFKDRRAMPALLEALDNPNIQDKAVSALAEIGDPSALESLLPPAGVIGEGGSARIIQALTHFDDPHVDAVLIASLKYLGGFWDLHGYPTLLVEVIRRIGPAQHAEAIAPLIEVLRTEQSPEIRASAAEALRIVTGQNFGMHYARWQGWRERTETGK
jgi:HEAT repeat protein